MVSVCSSLNDNLKATQGFLSAQWISTHIIAFPPKITFHLLWILTNNIKDKNTCSNVGKEISVNGTFLVNFVHIYQYVTGRTKSQFIFNLAESSSTGKTLFLIVRNYLANLKRFLKPIKIAELIIYTE